jgi:hypothetical protein
MELTLSPVVQSSGRSANPPRGGYYNNFWMPIYTFYSHCYPFCLFLLLFYYASVFYIYILPSFQLTDSRCGISSVYLFMSQSDVHIVCSCHEEGPLTNQKFKVSCIHSSEVVWLRGAKQGFDITKIAKHCHLCSIITRLTTVCNTQNYWDSELCSTSGILNTRKHNVWEN